jgi:hypothetical protein
VADALGVNVGERSEELVDVELDLEDGHDRLHLVEITRRPVYGLGHELKHQVEVDFVFLWLVSRQQRATHGTASGKRTRSPLL